MDIVPKEPWLLVLILPLLFRCCFASKDRGLSRRFRRRVGSITITILLLLLVLVLIEVDEWQGSQESGGAMRGIDTRSKMKD